MICSNNLKNFYLICLCLIFQQLLPTNALNVPDNVKKHAKKLHDTCQKKTGVTDALLMQGHQGIVPDDPTVKCYLHCLLDTVGLIDENHVVHLEYLVELVPGDFSDILQNLASKCDSQRGADGCETAYLTVKCYFEADKTTMTTVAAILFD